MSRCKFFGYAFTLLPLKKWQDFLIRSHMERCPECQKTLVSREDVQGITIQEKHCVDTESLWDGFEKKVRETKRSRPHVFGPRWAYGIAAVLVIVAATIWFVLSPQFQKAQIEESFDTRFRINYLKVANKPAQAYVFQPQDSHMILVWAQKNIRGE